MQLNYQYDYSILTLEKSSRVSFSYLTPVYNEADIVIGYEKYSGHLQNDVIDGIWWIHDQNIPSSQVDYLQFEVQRVLLPTITEDQVKELFTPVLSPDSGRMPF